MKLSKLNDCCTIIAGQSPESKYYNQDGDGLPFFQGKTDFGELYPTLRVYCKQPIRIAEKDDILLSVRAPVGATNLCPCKVCIGRGLTAIRPSRELITKYLLYFLRFFEVQLQQMGTGTTFKAITQQIVKNIEVPLPPIPEQERIVAHIEELFSELDAGVETLKKTKAQLDVYRQAVLKEAFEDTRFSRIVELSEVVDEIHIGPFGTMLHKHDYIQNGIPVINPTHLQDGKIISDSKNTISTRKAEELSSYKLQDNDILLGRRGEMGRCAPVTSKEIGWICGTGNIIIRLKKEFSATFYTKILSNPHTVAFLEKHANGTTMKNLNEKIVKRIPVPYITREQQKGVENEIESRLSVCNNIEQTIDAALEQAKALRHSILKEALKGRDDVWNNKYLV